MKKKLSVLLLVLSMALSLMPVSVMAEGPFPDVDENSRYAEAIEFVSSIGIMIGDTDGNFNPNNTVIRAEMATLLCRMMGEKENLTKSNDFTDVPTKHWANAYISRAAKLGLVNGYGGRKFGPQDDITYEQAVTMIVRAVGEESEAKARGGYPDGYLSVAAEYGYLEGISASKGDSFSRAEVAQLLLNYYNNNI